MIDKTKNYLVEFDYSTGANGVYNIRVVGLVTGIYAPLDCPSGKSLSVTLNDPLGEGVHSIWVSDLDNCKLIEVDYCEWDLYNIWLGDE